MTAPIVRPDEALGAFYLGEVSPPANTPAGAPRQPLVYDAKDLTTHALCVGMTGSGKTGLCITLLEEAAIDGVPAIAIDLKGDLSNLLLSFPKLRPEDFLPWIDQGEAARKGRTVEQHAAAVAALWQQGLAESGQDGSRIARMRSAVDLAVFTPGSASGRPLSVLRSLDAPAPAVAADPDLLRDRIGSTVSSLLALLGIDADPLQSREHILLSQLLQHAWAAGRSVPIGELIRTILEPPIERVGVMDLDTFFPKKDRSALAMRLNSLLAAPSFAAWMEGEPLNVERLLWTPEGKPRVSILSLAHLSDDERMFFVTLLLGEVLAWMRTQPGTSSLRALLYMDEVFGFFPPVKNPPSKTPMLTLLKQARAFGLGIVLATQNPVDVDYKGLSNCGTWWLGRLQTKRDLDRILDGLEGAAASANSSWSRAEAETTLAGLEGRQFVMNNVHRAAPVLFKTRWALSYLRGPLTREQLKGLLADHTPDAPAAGVAQLSEAPVPVAATPTGVGAATDAASMRPVIAGDAEELFVFSEAPQPTYRPHVLAAVSVHYTHRYADLDVWLEPTLVVALPSGNRRVPWTEATWHRPNDLQLSGDPAEGARFGELKRKDLDAKGITALRKSLTEHLYRSEALPVFYNRKYKLWSRYGESRAQFTARAQMQYREARDLEVEKLRKKYAPKIDKLTERIRKAEQKVERESAQKNYQTFDTAVSVGSTVVGAIFGGRSVFGGTRSAMKSAGRVARERGDVSRARDDVATLKTQLYELQDAFESDSAALEDKPLDVVIEDKSVKPKKGDITLVRFAILWVP